MKKTRRYLVARIADFEVGLPVDEIGSLIRCQSVQKSPVSTGPAAWMLEPVEAELWQLHRAFGREPAIENGSPAVDILGSGSRALLVDSLGTPVELKDEEIQRCPPILGISGVNLFSGLAVQEGNVLPLVDLSVVPQLSRSPDLGRWQVRHPTTLMEGEAPTGPAPSSALQLKVVDGGAPLAAIVSLSEVRAVTSDLKLVKWPLRPPFVRGLTLWEDQVATWLDLPRLLGRQPSAPTGRQVVVGTPRGDLLAFDVTSETETLLATTQIEALTSPSEFLEGVLLLEGTRDGVHVMVPDFEAIDSVRVLVGD